MPTVVRRPTSFYCSRANVAKSSIRTMNIDDGRPTSHFENFQGDFWMGRGKEECKLQRARDEGMDGGEGRERGK